MFYVSPGHQCLTTETNSNIVLSLTGKQQNARDKWKTLRESGRTDSLCRGHNTVASRGFWLWSWHSHPQDQRSLILVRQTQVCIEKRSVSERCHRQPLHIEKNNFLFFFPKIIVNAFTVPHSRCSCAIGLTRSAWIQLTSWQPRWR